MRFRFLGCILLLAGLAALWELRSTQTEDSPEANRLPYVMRDLYPTSARILYTEGVALVIEGNLLAARRKFEEALATGDRTNEDLLYNYAITLVSLQADSKDIDAAIASWRYNFPFSDREDPRTAVASSKQAPALTSPQK